MLPIHIQFSKNSKAVSSRPSAFSEKLSTAWAESGSLTADRFGVVGLGRVELPTSPLSGVRSSHLSYRPGSTGSSPVSAQTGGADRDRTDGLLNANQALSQLSYSPSGDAFAIFRGQLDAARGNQAAGALHFGIPGGEHRDQLGVERLRSTKRFDRSTHVLS